MGRERWTRKWNGSKSCSAVYATSRARWSCRPPRASNKSRACSSTGPRWRRRRAVALMLLAGAVFVASRAGRVAQRLAGAPPRPAPQEMIKTEETPSAATDREPPDARVAEKGKDERKPERQGAALAPVIGKRRGGAATYTASRNTRRKNAPAHAARDMTPPDGVLAVVRQRQQEAKEQLIYALRLTGAKLNEVQAKVRSADEGKSLYEERNKIK